MKFTQYNYLHQSYLDPVKISKMFGGMTRNCPRCTASQASFYHMVWECGKITEFWERIVAHINRTLHRNMQVNPLECLLGVLKRPTLKKVGNRLIDLSLGVARKSIAKYWKSPAGPKYEGWNREMSQWCRAEEEIILKEERMGVRTQPLSQLWREVIEAFALAGEEDDNEQNGRALNNENEDNVSN